MRFIDDLIHGSPRAARVTASFSAFLLSFVAYLLTIEPDASYWDCPEYLVTATRLEIGHPPGNPVWTITARIFSLFGGSDPQQIAIAVNISSALFTALAVGMLASVTFMLLLRIGFPDTRTHSLKSNLTRALPAIAGAMCFGWADSPWFSAVEAEVYAMSLFLTALCIRLMAGWAAMRPGPGARRHLLLIVYLTGLSIGVHQLNLLVIPALGLIWLFRRHRESVGIWRILLVLLASMGAVGVILLGMMPGVIEGAAATELLCVNSFHWPYHSGVWTFWGVALLLAWGIPVALRRIPQRWQLIAWIPAMLLTGYSSYMILLVRSAAEPPMNEGAPSDILSLAGYLGRDQYGSTPLFYGRTPYSRPLRQENIRPDGTPEYSRTVLTDGRAMYARTDSGYHLYEHVRRPVYQPELNMWFPRLTSSDPSDISAYADWAGMTQETMVPVEVSYAIDSLGNPVGKLSSDGKRIRETELRPTYLQQLRYLFGYQIGYMYFRYLLWNYSGRQNDRFAVGEVEHGNFITGIPPVDDLMLGPQDKLPAEIGAKNEGHNVYFMLPLILGIMGIFMLQGYGRTGHRANLVILILFLMTGLAIVFYINQSPREPRERDYSFLGSLWAYAIWIAAGMAMLLRQAMRPKKRKARRCAVAAASLFCMALPVWMLCQNYGDHDRSGRRGVTDYAANLLESLETNAILFTNGDNYTFPLWWAQEVAGIRPDVTIINTAYLGTNWYIRQLRADNAVSKGLLMQADKDRFKFGEFKYTQYASSPVVPTHTDTLCAVDATEALRALYAEGDSHRLPAMLRIANPEEGDSVVVRTSAVASGSSSLSLRALAMLDIVASNAAAEHPRPVYWMSSLSSSDYGGMLPFTARMLHSRRLVYTDSLPCHRLHSLLDIDMEKASITRSGRIIEREGGYIYADDTFGRMITSQRLGLLRLGGRLIQAGRYREAIEVAGIIEMQFPASIWEYQVFTEVDSTCNEGIDLARIYLASAYYAKPRSYQRIREYDHAMLLLRREAERLHTWDAYYKALPPRLRKVMSPKNRRKARVLPAYADSLLRRYSGNPPSYDKPSVVRRHPGRPK